MALTVAPAFVLPALAGTAPPAVGAGGVGGSGPSGSISSTRDAGYGGCTGCDDHDACTNDLCDADYNCVHNPVMCDDGLRCTDDMCDHVTGCVYTPKDCSTGTVCILAACSEATGACVVTGKLTCFDHDACTDDSCDPELGCLHAPILCNDGDICTYDGCDPIVGCVHRPGACEHRIGTSAPLATASGVSAITSASGETADVGDPPVAEDRGASRTAREGRRGASGDSDLCALATGSPEDALMRILLAGWPGSPGAGAALALDWDLQVRAAAALDLGVCGSTAIDGLREAGSSRSPR